MANFLAVPTVPSPKAKKTGSARVLTSSEHIRMLEEREKKKREEAEKKEQRRQDRLTKKKEMEEKKKEKALRDNAQKKGRATTYSFKYLHV